MRDAEPVGRFCPLCGGRGVESGVVRGVPVRACCETLLAWCWSSVAEYARFYTGTDYHWTAMREAGWRTHVDRFDEHRLACDSRLAWLDGVAGLDQGASILDVGTGNAAFVVAARARSHRALGVEPSWPMVAWAHEQHAAPVVCSAYDQIGGWWDLVCAIDVIEHLTDPHGFLSWAGRRSRMLYIETPDWTSDRDLAWKHIRPREHVCLYSDRALRALAVRQGWEPEAVDRPIEGKLAVLFRRTH